MATDMIPLLSIYEDHRSKILWTFKHSKIFSGLPKCIKKYIVQDLPNFNILKGGHKTILISGYGNSGKTYLRRSIVQNIKHNYDDLSYDYKMVLPSFHCGTTLLVLDENLPRDIATLLKNHKLFDMTIIIATQIMTPELLNHKFDVVLFNNNIDYDFYEKYFSDVMTGDQLLEATNSCEEYRVIIKHNNYTNLFTYKAPFN